MPPSWARAFTGAGLCTMVVGCGAAADATPTIGEKRGGREINARTVRHRSRAVLGRCQNWLCPAERVGTLVVP